MTDESVEELETVQCSDCAEPVPTDDARDVNGMPHCDSCADQYGTCEDCDGQVRNEDLVLVHATSHFSGRGREQYVCDSCSDNYSFCDSCSERHSDHTELLDGSVACSGCIENDAVYCDDCGGYYWSDDASEHNHDGCECESPAQTFRIKNGNGWLHNDTRLRVDLASGTISEVGMDLISNLLVQEGRRLRELDLPGEPYSDEWYEARSARMEGVSAWRSFAYDVAKNVGTEWQTNRGNFTKRLSRAAHKAGLRITPDLLTRVGNVAREQSVGSSVNLEVTRDLNLPAVDFYHEDSCWWQSYSYSRCALKSMGGIGLRTFSGETNPWGTSEITGRAWAMPMRVVPVERLPDEVWVETPGPCGYTFPDGSECNCNAGGTRSMVRPEGPARLTVTLEPTFETETPDAWVVFNGYGDLSGYAGARILGHMSGLTYKRIDFGCNPMYVNAGGYLVASEDVCMAIDGLYLSAGSDDGHSDLWNREQQRTLVAA